MQKHVVFMFFILCSMLIAQKTQVDTHDVRDNIHMLTGSGGNIAVSIGKDGVKK